MVGLESSKFMIGLKSKYQQSSCINDILHAINFMRGNGRLTRVTNLSITVSGVMLTIILLAIATARNLIRITLIVVNAILYAILVGDQLNIIVSLVLMME